VDADCVRLFFEVKRYLRGKLGNGYHFRFLLQGGVEEMTAYEPKNSSGRTTFLVARTLDYWQPGVFRKSRISGRELTEVKSRTAGRVDQLCMFTVKAEPDPNLFLFDVVVPIHETRR